MGHSFYQDAKRYPFRMASNDSLSKHDVNLATVLPLHRFLRHEFSDSSHHIHPSSYPRPSRIGLPDFDGRRSRLPIIHRLWARKDKNVTFVEILAKSSRAHVSHNVTTSQLQIAIVWYRKLSSVVWSFLKTWSAAFMCTADLHPVLSD